MPLSGFSQHSLATPLSQYIGDYVILLSSGLTWYSALIFNLFAAITAVLGFFIGVAAGTSSEVANEWILAVAGGLFIYIALVDLVSGWDRKWVGQKVDVAREGRLGLWH